MENYEEKLKNYIKTNNIKAQHLSFSQSCHSVNEAAQAVNANEDDFVKNICMTYNNKIIVAIVKGEDRASTSRVAKALQIERPEIATQEEILNKTGFPCGGTPSFGYEATFIVDPKIMEKDFVYTGGGSQTSLIKIQTQELINANKAKILRVRK